MNMANLDRLIAHLKSIGEDQFDMSHTDPRLSDCGTACCIGGHIGILIGEDYFEAFDFLGDFEYFPYGQLFCPPGWAKEKPGNKQYTLSRALRMLRHMRAEYLRAGVVVVDWDAPDQVSLTPWQKPCFVETTKRLPDEIARLVGHKVAEAQV